MGVLGFQAGPEGFPLVLYLEEKRGPSQKAAGFVTLAGQMANSTDLAKIPVCPEGGGVNLGKAWGPGLGGQVDKRAFLCAPSSTPGLVSHFQAASDLEDSIKRPSASTRSQLKILHIRDYGCWL